LWRNPGDPEWRVPVIEVEDAVRAACLRWHVLEVTADPSRWTRTLQVLADERIPVSEFPQSPSRMTPATTALYEAVVNKQVTHSGDDRLAKHVANCVLKADSRGTRLVGTQALAPAYRFRGRRCHGPRQGTHARRPAEGHDLRARLTLDRYRRRTWS
jgi:hypothetical protein